MKSFLRKDVAISYYGALRLLRPARSELAMTIPTQTEQNP
jgi:hypothetical protein